MSDSEKYTLPEVQVALSPQERFEEYLQTKSMRNTEQRRILLDQIFHHHDHFDADALIEQLPSKGKPGYVSRPTVYRTLNEFVDAGLLRRFELDGRSVYEHDYGYPDHDHLHCTKCQKLIEFQSDALSELLANVAAEHRFRVSGHRLIVSGVCEQCNRSRQRTKRKQDLV